MEDEAAMSSYMRYDEANPLPDLSDILLSNETFCNYDINKKDASFNEFGSKGAVCQIVGSCDSEPYTALLSSPQSNNQFQSLDNNFLFSSQALNTERIATTTTISSVPDSIDEEEFLYQFNLSKCDRGATVKSKTKPKPMTRSSTKLKVAKHNKSEKSSETPKIRKTTLKKKIEDLKKIDMVVARPLKLTLKPPPRVKLRKPLSTNLPQSGSEKVAQETPEDKEMLGGICRVCNFVYASKAKREKHVKSLDHIIKADCYLGTDHSAIQDEEKELREVKLPGKCLKCNENFTVRRSMITHYRKKHTGLKPYKCVRCSMLFYRNCDLLIHLRQHLGANAFKCPQCTMTFRQQYKLMSHLISKHGMEDERPRNYKCTECNETFLTKTSVNKHIQTHTGYNRVTCHVCGHGFRNTSSLLDHQRVHSGEKPYKCDECSFITSTKSLLDKHKRKHTGEKTYKCRVCSYKTNHPTGLKRHMLQHSGLKPFKCPYCDYRCTNIENIRKHVKKTKKHVGLKIYPCPQCQFSSDEGADLLKHVKQHHYPYLEEDSPAKLAGILVSNHGQNERFVLVNSATNNLPVSMANTKDKMLPRAESPTPNTQGLRFSDPQTIEMLMTDSDIFQSNGEVKGQCDSDEEMNGLDADFLSALIKIPNLQKVILPQVGDGNSPVTLVIGNERLPELATEDETEVKSKAQLPTDHCETIQGNTDESRMDSLSTTSSGHQHFIISASGIQSCPKP
uniref:Zinc finger protein 260 n=1 Tax=Phallusia mammillata TaxID=59560 RepID=A0A6F9DY88_9ASCI|nr:zinc finger protein 260 [Phallusia mammillata]